MTPCIQPLADSFFSVESFVINLLFNLVMEQPLTRFLPLTSLSFHHSSFLSIQVFMKFSILPHWNTPRVLSAFSVFTTRCEVTPPTSWRCHSIVSHHTTGQWQAVTVVASSFPERENSSLNSTSASSFKRSRLWDHQLRSLAFIALPGGFGDSLCCHGLEPTLWCFSVLCVPLWMQIPLFTDLWSTPCA